MANKNLDNNQLNAGLSAGTSDNKNMDLETALKEGRFNIVIYKNKMNGENSPDIYGHLKINGMDIRLSFWKKKSEKGITYYNGTKTKEYKTTK